MINPLPTEFKDRARECGYTLYQLKGIHREDKEARKAHFRENYTFLMHRWDSSFIYPWDLNEAIFWIWEDFYKM